MGIFDKEKFAHLLNKAKGNRSINKYAADCGIAAAHISRLLRSLVDTPPNPPTIEKFTKHSIGNVSYEDLMAAAGHTSQLESAFKAKELGATIKEVRKEKGMSISELAMLCGIEPSYIEDIEKGGITSPPNIETLGKMATSLNIPFFNLLKYCYNVFEQALSLMGNPSSNDLAILSELDNIITTQPQKTLDIEFKKIPIIRSTEFKSKNNTLGYDYISTNEISNKEDFFLIVDEDSINRIQPGDKVLICSEKLEAKSESGKIFAILINDRVFLKRIKYHGDSAILYTDKYEPSIYKKDEISLLGVVKEVRFKP